MNAVHRCFKSNLLARAGLLAAAALLTGPLLLGSTAQAYPLNPWGGITGEGAFSITPFLYVYNGGTEYYPYFYGAYGLSEKVDIMAGIGAGLYTGDEGGAELVGLELFPRFFFAESWAAVAHVYWEPGLLKIAPEIHGVYTKDKFALTLNASYQPAFVFGDEGGFSAGGLSFIIAPEINFSSQFSAFLEVDPEFSFGEDADGNFTVSSAVTLVPGIGFALDPDQTHIFSVGVQIALPTEEGADFFRDNISLGLWYFTSFGGKSEEAEARARARKRFTAFNNLNWE